MEGRAPRGAEANGSTYKVLIRRCNGIDELVRAQEQLSALGILESLAGEPGLGGGGSLGGLLGADEALSNRLFHSGRLCRHFDGLLSTGGGPNGGQER